MNMSIDKNRTIRKLCFESYQNFTQNFYPPKEYKIQYGEVTTPFSLIETMLDFLPEEVFKNPDIKWLDPAAGHGYFMISVCNRLDKHIKMDTKTNTNTNISRREHILRNMIHMIEINPVYYEHLFNIFGHVNENENCISNESNIKICNFLDLDESNPMNKYDIIVGNPPYNSKGFKKVPTNTNKTIKKSEDGETIWVSFIKKTINIIKEGGYACMIIPCIWMKEDKAKIHTILCSMNIIKLKCFTNTETNTIFRKQAQTPTCIILFQKPYKIQSYKHTQLEGYDSIYKKYVLYSYYSQSQSHSQIPRPIPTNYYSIINKLIPYVEKYGSIYDMIEKTNMPKKEIKFTVDNDNNNDNKQYPYKCVHTCIKDKDKETNKTIEKIKQYSFSFKYSNKPCCYYGEKKLIMAHKMHGIPYVDEEGKYGISNRDTYIIKANNKHKHNIKNKNISLNELYILKYFLSGKWIQCIFDTTRYRMGYLEKYAFQFIPNILNMNMSIFGKDYQIKTMIEEINMIINIEKEMYTLFQFTDKEIQYIEKTKKHYLLISCHS